VNPKAALLDASGRGVEQTTGHFANAATLFRRFPIGATPQRRSRFHLSTETWSSGGQKVGIRGYKYWLLSM
jgi:hypothetical protein